MLLRLCAVEISDANTQASSSRRASAGAEVGFSWLSLEQSGVKLKEVSLQKPLTIALAAGWSDLRKRLLDKREGKRSTRPRLGGLFL